jgi:ribosomal protein S27E
MSGGSKCGQMEIKPEGGNGTVSGAISTEEFFS